MPLSSQARLRLLHRFRGTGAILGGCLALVIAVGSLLGVLHAIVHPPENPLESLTLMAVQAAGAGTPAAAGASGAESPDGKARSVAGVSWLERLFDHKAGDRDCRIFDKLCHGPAAPAAAMLSLSFALPQAALLMTLEGEFLARWTALFDARGPPRLS